MAFLGTFSMSFYIIFWTYSEKISLLEFIDGPGRVFFFSGYA